MITLPKDIEYVLTDCDGVLTDGFVYITDNTDNHAKRLNFKDIMGVYLSIANGYKVGIISGESCNAINYLQKTFGLQEVHTDIRNKKEVFLDIVKRNNLNPQKIVYIGDDVNDIEILKLVGYPICVKNAVKQVKELSNIQITENDGGFAAFREVIDALIW